MGDRPCHCATACACMRSEKLAKLEQLLVLNFSKVDKIAPIPVAALGIALYQEASRLSGRRMGDRPRHCATACACATKREFFIDNLLVRNQTTYWSETGKPKPTPLQGYLANKKLLPPRTLQQDYT